MIYFENKIIKYVESTLDQMCKDGFENAFRSALVFVVGVDEIEKLEQSLGHCFAPHSPPVKKDPILIARYVSESVFNKESAPKLMREFKERFFYYLSREIFKHCEENKGEE